MTKETETYFASLNERWKQASLDYRAAVDRRDEVARRAAKETMIFCVNETIRIGREEADRGDAGAR